MRIYRVTIQLAYHKTTQHHQLKIILHKSITVSLYSHARAKPQQNKGRSADAR